MLTVTPGIGHRRQRQQRRHCFNNAAILASGPDGDAGRPQKRGGHVAVVGEVRLRASSDALIVKRPWIVSAPVKFCGRFTVGLLVTFPLSMFAPAPIIARIGYVENIRRIDVVGNPVRVRRAVGGERVSPWLPPEPHLFAANNLLCGEGCRRRPIENDRPAGSTGDQIGWDLYAFSNRRNPFPDHARKMHCGRNLHQGYSSRTF